MNTVMNGYRTRRGPTAARRIEWALVLAALLLAANPAHAQSLGSGVPGSWMSTTTDGPPASGIRPAAWWDRGGFGWSLGGSLALDLIGAHALVSEREEAPGAMVLELGAWQAGTSVGATPIRSSALSARLHLMKPTLGIWFAGSGFDVDRTRGMLPWLGAGTWWERGRFTFTTRLVHLLSPLRTEAEPQGFPGDTTFDRVPPVASAAEDIRYLTGAETSVTWALKRFVVQSRVGLAVGKHERPARWGELHTAYWARPGLGLFARVRGTTEAPSAIEAARETHAALGVQLSMGGVPKLRLSPGSETKLAFRMNALEGSRYRFTWNVPARSIELLGDPTDWQPLAATYFPPNRWEAVVTLGPGVHRLAVRIDGGAWQAPPGLPTAPDGFGGEVGLITVE